MAEHTATMNRAESDKHLKEHSKFRPMIDGSITNKIEQVNYFFLAKKQLPQFIAWPVVVIFLAYFLKRCWNRE